MTVDLHWNTVDKWVTVVTLLFANPSEPMMCYEYYKSTAAAPKTCNDAVALFIVTPCIISIINTLAIKLWGQDTEYILWKTEKGGKKKSDVSEWNNSLDWEVTRYFFFYEVWCQSCCSQLSTVPVLKNSCHCKPLRFLGYYSKSTCSSPCVHIQYVTVAIDKNPTAVDVDFNVPFFWV